jgi:lipid-A-disaccharide synthase
LKYYIIAGEASGDLHASNLVRELRQLNPDATFRGWGGDLMQHEGVEIIKHYRDLAFMGFLEVVANLRTILNNISFCKEDIAKYKPDAVILVDYPGFNLRIAEFLKKNKIRVIYYISPQVWAWKQSRVKKIRRDVDLMLVILPFEKQFYQKHGMDVVFVGHPLLDAVERYHSKSSASMHSDKPIIALLPGSRKQEISVMLPLMIESVKKMSQYQIVIAGAPSIPESFYQSYMSGNEQIVYNKTYELLSNAYAALVTSGTATLETALFEVPQVVCYKGNRISYLIARQLIRINYISLVNLIMDREVVRELIQDQLTVFNLRSELQKITNGPERNIQIRDYAELEERLGGPGASKRAAEVIFQMKR